MSEPGTYAVEAAKTIATNTDNASKAVGGMRFLFQEYVNEQAEVIQRAIDNQLRNFRREIENVCADLERRDNRIVALEALLERVPHDRRPAVVGQRGINECYSGCPRCAYEKTK